MQLFGVPAHQLDRRTHPVGYVPQARRLNLAFPLSGRDVVALGRIGRRGPFRVLRDDDRAAVARAIELVGLADKADRPFAGLSGGEQQRLLLARALTSEARLFCLDEPATGLDAATQERLGAIIDGLVADGSAVLVSTHDLSPENLDRFDRLVCLNGAVVAEGPPAEVTNLDVWRRLFSGRQALGLGV